MAERDYALKMRRLLDPEAHFIDPKQIIECVICVKSASRKSLPNVFQDGMCHPKMAMVIDDRSKVWEDKDQPRVHVVLAFTPYYAPQAETAKAVSVLPVARNVACNVRDVSNYLMSEECARWQEVRKKLKSNSNRAPLLYSSL